MKWPNPGDGRRLGDWLRAARRKKGEPLRVVAAAADMDTALLSKIELGQRLPTDEQSGKLARFLAVDEQELQARRIAEKFRMEFREHPAAPAAIMLLAEDSGLYRTRSSR